MKKTHLTLAAGGLYYIYPKGIHRPCSPPTYATLHRCFSVINTAWHRLLKHRIVPNIVYNCCAHTKSCFRPSCAATRENSRLNMHILLNVAPFDTDIISRMAEGNAALWMRRNVEICDSLWAMIDVYLAVIIINGLPKSANGNLGLLFGRPNCLITSYILWCHQCTLK